MPGSHAIGIDSIAFMGYKNKLAHHGFEPYDKKGFKGLPIHSLSKLRQTSTHEIPICSRRRGLELVQNVLTARLLGDELINVNRKRLVNRSS